MDVISSWEQLHLPWKFPIHLHWCCWLFQVEQASHYSGTQWASVPGLIREDRRLSAQWSSWKSPRHRRNEPARFALDRHWQALLYWSLQVRTSCLVLAVVPRLGACQLLWLVGACSPTSIHHELLSGMILFSSLDLDSTLLVLLDSSLWIVSHYLWPEMRKCFPVFSFKISNILY